MSIRPNGAYVGYARFSSIFALLSRHIRRGGGRRARVLCPRSRYIVGGRASPNGHRRTLRRGSHPEILRLTTFSTNGLSDDGRVRCLESVADRGEYSFARVGNDDVCDAGGRRTAHSQLKSWVSDVIRVLHIALRPRLGRAASRRQRSCTYRK